MSYTARQVINLCVFIQEQPALFKEPKIFRAAASSDHVDLLIKYILPSAQKCRMPKDFITKAEVILSSKIFKGVKITSHDWAVLIKQVFMQANILDLNCLQTACAWDIFQGQLKLVFLNLFNTHNPNKLNQNDNCFFSASSTVIEIIQNKTLQFLGQLSITDKQQPLDAIYAFLQLGHKTQVEEDNDMDGKAMALMLAPSLLHGLNLHGSFLSTGQASKFLGTAIKTEYQFMTFITKALLDLPIYKHEGDFLDHIKDQQQPPLKYVQKLEEMQNHLWQKRPLSFKSPHHKENSGKNKRMGKKHRSNKNILADSFNAELKLLSITEEAKPIIIQRDNTPPLKFKSEDLYKVKSKPLKKNQ